MNSRERVQTALNHNEPDKVPIDLGGNQSGIHIRAYKRLLDHLGIVDKNIQWADFVQQIANPCDEVLERFQIDVRYIRPLGGMVSIKDHEPEYVGQFVGVSDQFGVFWGDRAEKDVEQILYYDPVIHPFADFTTVQEIQEYDWPDGTDKTPFEGLRDHAKYMREKTNFALSTPPIGCIFEYTTFLFGFTKVMSYLRRKPELLAAAMKKLLKYWSDYCTAFLGEVGEFLDVVCINGDLAEQSGPILNPKLYDKTIVPLEKQLADLVHSLTPAKINYHCCGSVPAFIPSWNYIGYDVYNPVQISAFDMEPCNLKARFGEKITFWGGLCNTQKTLPFGTPELIRKEVEMNFKCFKPGGGYVAANIHNITAEVPPENIVAMFDAAIEFRDY
jgi:uroporphyrinogen decarboxylase